MQRCRIVILSLLFSILMTACNANTSSDNNNIVYGLTLNVSGIDPHIHRSTELGIVLRQVYDTLVYRHPETGEFVGGLAESWTISDDLRVYVFDLKQGVSFHDGTMFNADAVVANFDRIFDPAMSSQKARFLLSRVQSYRAIGTYQFEITLEEPFTPLLDSLSQVYTGIASPTALAEYAESPMRYQYHQVGTGPFRFVEYVPEDRIIIQRNPDYSWGPEFYGEVGEQAIQRVEFRFFRDAATRLAALENGDADIMGELLPTDAQSAVSNPEVELLPVEIPGQPLQFYFNTNEEPTNDIRVRQALIYAVNRTSIVEAVYQGFSPIAWGPLSAESLFYNRGVQDVYAYNLEQAQDLLASVGYQDSDEDGILEKDGTDLTITVIQPPWGLVPQVAQLLENQWQSLGIDVDLKPVPGYVALIEAVDSGDYNLASFDQPGIDPYILNQAYLSDAPDNWTGYADPDLDTILINASQITDSEQRHQLYGQAQAIIMQNALVLPIRDYVNLNAYRSEIEGLQFDPYGWFPLLHDVTINES